MENSATKLLICCLLVLIHSIVFANNESELKTNDPELDEEAIMKRIEEMESDIVPPKYDEVVKSYLKTYTIKRRHVSSQILGNQVVYFPLFEEMFAEGELPTDLKYLSVVESALNPNAVSRVGATGLWQFMPKTGVYFGLELNTLVDERRDPKRSTEAAVIYLRKLYKRFNNWELAIAAYNSGEGRVARAVKRSRSKNFWKVRRFLPRETRNYVPAFIAATYLLKYYEAHNLEPDYPALDIQLSETISVYDTITFYEIAQVTNLPLDIIEKLNPAYVKGIIPAKEKGRYLTLPKRVLPIFLDYLDTKRPDSEARKRILSTPVYVSIPMNRDRDNYEHTNYTVLSDDSLESIARKLGCTLHQLKAWNDLKSEKLMLGQTLKAFIPKKAKPLHMRETIIPPDIIQPRLMPESLQSVSETNSGLQSQIIENNGYYCYELYQKETPLDIAKKLKFLSYDVLCKLNGLQSNIPLKKGTLVKVVKIPEGGR